MKQITKMLEQESQHNINEIKILEELLEKWTDYLSTITDEHEREEVISSPVMIELLEKWGAYLDTLKHNQIVLEQNMASLNSLVDLQYVK